MRRCHGHVSKKLEVTSPSAQLLFWGNVQHLSVPLFGASLQRPLITRRGCRVFSRGHWGSQLANLKLRNSCWKGWDFSTRDRGDGVTQLVSLWLDAHGFTSALAPPAHRCGCLPIPRPGSVQGSLRVGLRIGCAVFTTAVCSLSAAWNEYGFQAAWHRPANLATHVLLYGPSSCIFQAGKECQNNSILQIIS